MPLFRRPLPRRALLAAALGALYGMLILPAPATLLGVSFLGVAWFLLAVSLLFLVPLAYHAYTLWGIVWVVWRVIVHARDPPGLFVAAFDLVIPIASVALLMTSGYLDEARA